MKWVHLHVWKHEFVKYCNEFRDYKEVDKTAHCLHLQSVDGNRSECINAVMAPLTGHK